MASTAQTGPDSTIRTPQTEADRFGAFARRILRAYGRRVADRDIESLAGLAGLRDDVDVVIRQTVAGLLEAGYSWADIGRQLGMTRQGAFRKYGQQ